MKNWKKLISAGLALGLVLTSVPQSTSVVYAQENGTLQNVTFEQEQEAVQNAPITVQKVNGLCKWCGCVFLLKSGREWRKVLR